MRPSQALFLEELRKLSPNSSYLNLLIVWVLSSLPLRWKIWFAVIRSGSEYLQRSSSFTRTYSLGLRQKTLLCCQTQTWCVRLSQNISLWYFKGCLGFRARTVISSRFRLLTRFPHFPISCGEWNVHRRALWRRASKFDVGSPTSAPSTPAQSSGGELQPSGPGPRHCRGLPLPLPAPVIVRTVMPKHGPRMLSPISFKSCWMHKGGRDVISVCCRRGSCDPGRTRRNVCRPIVLWRAHVSARSNGKCSKRGGSMLRTKLGLNGANSGRNVERRVEGGRNLKTVSTDKINAFVASDQINHVLFQCEWKCVEFATGMNTATVNRPRVSPIRGKIL